MQEIISHFWLYAQLDIGFDDATQDHAQVDQDLGGCKSSTDLEGRKTER